VRIGGRHDLVQIVGVGAGGHAADRIGLGGRREYVMAEKSAAQDVADTSHMLSIMAMTSIVRKAIAAAQMIDELGEDGATVFDRLAASFDNNAEAVRRAAAKMRGRGVIE
jgi:uncharacterized protein with PhoU and TrkA domain